MAVIEYITGGKGAINYCGPPLKKVPEENGRIKNRRPNLKKIPGVNAKKITGPTCILGMAWAGLHLFFRLPGIMDTKLEENRRSEQEHQQRKQELRCQREELMSDSFRQQRELAESKVETLLADAEEEGAGEAKEDGTTPPPSKRAKESSGSKG